MFISDLNDLPTSFFVEQYRIHLIPYLAIQSNMLSEHYYVNSNFIPALNEEKLLSHFEKGERAG
jgi:hypothetical protein